MVGRLALTMPIQFSTIAQIAGWTSAPNVEVSISDELDGIVAYR